MLEVFIKYAKFVGPGFLIAVAYIDPGNYATDVAAGAETKFALLFIVLMSNLFAIFLQSLCIKLGSVTGLNLAENCRAHLPKWLTIILYICAESAIIATDIAEVVGSAIALNLLLHIPLVAGCAITLVDVLVILIFYRPNGSMTAVRTFELFVMMLVLGVVVCFCIQLSLMPSTAVGEVFRGYIPSAAVIESNGLYLSCGILGATVMPHSIFLGSGIVQSRLKRFDIDEGRVTSSIPIGSNEKDERYRPSVAAIRNCLKYSIIELALSLFTFALFVNSSILIVAGTSLFANSEAGEADLFGIHKLLSDTISPVAGTIFALALLLSGISAGIVCTMAGQMVSEGMLNWSIAPWLRRLITRSISIIPSIIIAAAVGKEGLNATLTATQVVLSVILPFVTAPLIYFTCRNRYMTVETGTPADGPAPEGVKMRNHWAVAVLAILIWLVIAVMNVALLVLVGMGKA
ncbi:NRAMP family [Lipomyces starkeyi]